MTTSGSTTSCSPKRPSAPGSASRTEVSRTNTRAKPRIRRGGGAHGTLQHGVGGRHDAGRRGTRSRYDGTRRGSGGSTAHGPAGAGPARSLVVGTVRDLPGGPVGRITTENAVTLAPGPHAARRHRGSRACASTAPCRRFRRESRSDLVWRAIRPADRPRFAAAGAGERLSAPKRRCRFRRRAAREGNRPCGSPATARRRSRTPSAPTATAGSRTAAVPPKYGSLGPDRAGPGCRDVRRCGRRPGTRRASSSELPGSGVLAAAGRAPRQRSRVVPVSDGDVHGQPSPGRGALGGRLQRVGRGFRKQIQRPDRVDPPRPAVVRELGRNTLDDPQQRLELAGRPA